MANNLFQILITESTANGLPPAIEEITKEMRFRFAEYNYSLWNDIALREFIAQHFEPAVLESYLKLVPYAYKSDLARYCLLFHYGGWYADLGLRFNERNVIDLVDNTLDMIFFWDLGDLYAPYRSFYDCMNGLLFSRAKNPIIKTAIDLIVSNCRSNFYGSDSMSPTGPGVLGRAIAINGKTERHFDGHFLMLTPYHNQKNRAYVLRDGTIMAWHRSTLNGCGKTLSELGAEGTNDYRVLWRDRKIYHN